MNRKRNNISLKLNKTNTRERDGYTPWGMGSTFASGGNEKMMINFEQKLDKQSKKVKKKPV
jgi:hypothetical protein